MPVITQAGPSRAPPRRAAPMSSIIIRLSDSSVRCPRPVAGAPDIFCQHQQGCRLRQCLLLAMQLALQFQDAPLVRLVPLRLCRRIHIATRVRLLTGQAPHSHLFNVQAPCSGSRPPAPLHSGWLSPTPLQISLANPIALLCAVLHLASLTPLVWIDSSNCTASSR